MSSAHKLMALQTPAEMIAALKLYPKVNFPSVTHTYFNATTELLLSLTLSSFTYGHIAISISFYPDLFECNSGKYKTEWR